RDDAAARRHADDPGARSRPRLPAAGPAAGRTIRGRHRIFDPDIVREAAMTTPAPSRSRRRGAALAVAVLALGVTGVLLPSQGLGTDAAVDGTAGSAA